MWTALTDMPILAHLLRPSAEHRLTVQRLLQLLKPQFSVEGSIAMNQEKAVYQLFVRYLREVSSGQRSCGDLNLNLEHILEFVTGASEEPLFGFEMAPGIKFSPASEVVVKKASSGDEETDGEPKVEGVFTPTSHTCGNILQLPRPTPGLPLPQVERLFTSKGFTLGFL